MTLEDILHRYRIHFDRNKINIESVYVYLINYY